MIIGRNTSVGKQIVVSLIAIALVSAFCFLFLSGQNYKVVAIVLLGVVSVLALLFDIVAVLISCILSALVWNFFFIPPLFTLHISDPADNALFFMYFFIALVNGVLTYQIKQQEKKIRDKEEKEASLRLYSTLFNSLSHELRTPISTVIGATDMLKASDVKLSDDQKSELIHEISDAGIRLNRQVENLLNMSRLESMVVKPRDKWLDLQEFIHQLLQQDFYTQHQSRLTLNIDEHLPLVKLDEGLLFQVVDNLLHNAINYTSKEVIIIITIIENNILQMLVEDNGPGFPDDELERVFEKFYRLPGTKIGGTGLGLSIAKGFIEAMNGTIQLENKKEGGARFIISFAAETSFLNQLKNE
jgi:two-component system, OmpR family, sensor histidine kinase KdpD